MQGPQITQNQRSFAVSVTRTSAHRSKNILNNQDSEKRHYRSEKKDHRHNPDKNQFDNKTVPMMQYLKPQSSKQKNAKQSIKMGSASRS